MEISLELQSVLPLTETTYFILLSISSGSKHGYAIMKDVSQLSQERVVLSTGTLYGALKRLLDQGWVERIPDPHPHNGARQRKFYKLSKHGAAVLEAEVERLNNLVLAAKKRPIRGKWMAPYDHG
jgi:DNA-binding PadR family transcriptional regulator